MKMFRKMLCLALALCLMLSLGLVASAYGGGEETASPCDLCPNGCDYDSPVYIRGVHTGPYTGHYNVMQKTCKNCHATVQYTESSHCKSNYCVYPYSVLLPY